MEFNKKIIYLRNKSNITQSQFAEILKVSRSTVSGWETGRNVPDIEMIVSICDFFNVSLDYMLRGDNKLIKKIGMSKKIKTFLIIFIFVLIFISLYFANKSYENNLNVINPNNLKIEKIEKKSVYLEKEHKTDYKYFLYVKLNSKFSTWDKYRLGFSVYPVIYYGKGIDKNFVFVSLYSRNSINIFSNIKNNKIVQKFEIPAGNNKGKNIALSGQNYDHSKDVRKTILSSKDNK
ncbi:helix-turn-helix transcriptional regulator [Apilactobacillus sp. M161]|uniref:Helix-turn-helix transcriptional regulator n=1 Tax=Apilactobacillus xinyiensis TaxID=2841032 RepID=A0ABT0I3B8_9LACO|nr:helix-turn-helix transcriptional regulator [Apilactobacillus xinyiensis]MCK8625216.1 helix-turn-helix transcriptional regulator [Apilactobacillus xinyiensis]